MATIECIIVDDENEALERLELLLSKFEEITIIDKINDAILAINRIVELNPKLVFIDVEMPRKTGFDVVENVREKNINPTFIFVTGYNQYAIKAIRTAAFDFLLKPIDIDELKEALSRYKRQNNQTQKKELAIKLKKEFALSDREIEIVNLVFEGKSSKEIAEILFISKYTVDTHRRNILEKTKKKSVIELFSLL